MTNAAQQATPATWTADSHGVEWQLELERSTLLPGRLVGGRVTLRAMRNVEARGLQVALVANEHWRYRVVHTNAKGQPRTEVRTGWEELIRQPVAVEGALRLAAGATWSKSFEVPVPPLGPASLQATESGLDWTLQAKLDIDDAFDSGLEGELVVAQPVALLRSGAVRVREFALYESADVAEDDLTGSIRLEPMPLIAGAPFTGRLELRLDGSMTVQEIRAELRSVVESTVSNGMREEIVAWSGVLAQGGSYDGTLGLEIAGALSARPLPTIELPHGRAHAQLHVILARAWARDVHLVRDVTIATTAEL
jgi:hypothetical protein